MVDHVPVDASTMVDIGISARKNTGSDENYPPIDDSDAVWDIKGQVMYVSYPRST